MGVGSGGREAGARRMAWYGASCVANVRAVSGRAFDLGPDFGAVTGYELGGLERVSSRAGGGGRASW